MGLRGPKPQKRVSTEWSPQLAYVVGLIATDGCLSRDKRHIAFTSQDRDLILLYQECLGIAHISIGYTTSHTSKKQCPRVQFGDVHFYQWLEGIGLTPKKSLTLGPLNIPDDLFFDFLRGCFDGDGTIYSFWDKRWASSFMFYIAFASGSKQFIAWLQNRIQTLAGIKGHISFTDGYNVTQLRYAKSESAILFQKMFYAKNIPYLQRKFLKAQKIFEENKNAVQRKNARVA